MMSFTTRALLLASAVSVSMAQIPRQFAKNITVYHVNPVIYGVAPVNMNTADLLGDMYFDLRSKALPIECASGDPRSKLDCDNAEVANNSALVITKLVLEIDTRDTGEYARCNICVNGSDHHGNNSCTDGVYDCTCYGSNGCTNAVGVQNISTMSAHECSQGSTAWECWHDATAHKTGGMWYSTTDKGYCGDGTHPPPPNCTWRVAQFIKRVNKTCSDNIIYGEVEGVGSACFKGCQDSGLGPTRNTSSHCWIGCFYDTVLGPDASTPGGKVGGMPLEDLITAWELPFASNDPALKGCPGLLP